MTASIYEKDLDRVVIGEGYQVRWVDVKDLQTCANKEAIDRRFSRLFGGAYPANGELTTMRRGGLDFKNLDASQTRPRGRLSPNDCRLYVKNTTDRKVYISAGDIVTYRTLGTGEDAACEAVFIRITEEQEIDLPYCGTSDPSFFTICVKTNWESYQQETMAYKNLNSHIVIPASITTRMRPSSTTDNSCVYYGGGYATYADALAAVPSGAEMLGIVCVTFDGNGSYLLPTDIMNVMPVVKLAPAIGGVEAGWMLPAHEGNNNPLSFLDPRWTGAHSDVGYPIVGSHAPNEVSTYCSMKDFDGMKFKLATILFSAATANQWVEIDRTMDWSKRFLWLMSCDYTYSNTLNQSTHGLLTSGTCNLHFPGSPKTHGISSSVSGATDDPEQGDVSGFAESSLPKLVNFGVGGADPFDQAGDPAGRVLKLRLYPPDPFNDPQDYLRLTVGDGSAPVPIEGALYAGLDSGAIGHKAYWQFTILFMTLTCSAIKL